MLSDSLLSNCSFAGSKIRTRRFLTGLPDFHMCSLYSLADNRIVVISVVRNGT